MKWEKLGQIIDFPASYPVVEKIDEIFRIYYASQIDKKSHVFHIDVDCKDPTKILYSTNTPVINPGPLGTFDCDGVAPRCIVNHNGQKRMYVIGWNKKMNPPYHLSVGVAVKEQGQWTKMLGPVLDRDFDDPYFCTSACVLHEEKWKCWYCSCTDWVNNDPVYLIKYAESEDGFRWNKTNIKCIDYDDFTKAIGWPMVWKENQIFKMIFSYRSDHPEYKTNKNYSYRLGYAESSDGANWTRKDDEVGIERSDSGWDSEMMAYINICDDFMFYNGNGFGKTGIGVAKKLS